MKMYCNWVNKTLEENEISKYCKPHSDLLPKNSDGDCVCMRCELSPQIALGMPVERLLAQLKQGDGE